MIYSTLCLSDGGDVVWRDAISGRKADIYSVSVVMYVGSILPSLLRLRDRVGCDSLQKQHCSQQCFGSGSIVDPYCMVFWIRIYIKNTERI